jgi:peptide-methionine (S)-S-oxide reductase
MNSSTNPMQPTVPDGLKSILLGLGCFWGAERLFWQQSGVRSTAVGYAGGVTSNPSYEAVCTGRTGHAEVVLVNFDPVELPLLQLLQVFWQAHDPTQGMRQGNDVGSQYRSVVYVFDTEDERIAQQSKAHYQQRLHQAGYGPITTEIRLQQTFYYAEDYHQKYLAKNPHGYCGLKGCNVTYNSATT